MAARNIKLTAAEYSPGGPEWEAASPAKRRRYWERFAELALKIKRDEIRRGIDVHGKPLKPVLPTSRPDGAAGKPLDPHYAESRTYRLLAATVHGDGVTLFWRGHGRRSWTTILGYHADGLVRGAPVRDTIGLSPAGQKRLKREAADFWRAISRVSARVNPPATPTPAPRKPTPAPSPAPPPASSPPRATPSSPSAQLIGSGKIVDGVHYLKPGQKPNPRSKYIQVTAPKGTPAPAPAPKPEPKPKRSPAPKPDTPPASPAPPAPAPAPPPPRSAPEPIPPRPARPTVRVAAPNPPAIARPAVPVPPAPPKPAPPLTPKVRSFAPAPPKPAPPKLPPLPRPVPPVAAPAPAPAAAPAPQTPAPQSLIQRSIEEARTKGIYVDQHAHAFLARRFGDRANRIPAAYASSTKTIYINERHPYWQDPQSMVGPEFKKEWWSSDSDEHAIHHELGHALHNLAVGDQTYERIGSELFGPAHARLVRAEVSWYAATEPAEFVAETYAALRAGRTFSAELMALYRQFGGPSL